MFAIYKVIHLEKREQEMYKAIEEFEIRENRIVYQNVFMVARKELSIVITLLCGSKIVFLHKPSLGMDITNKIKIWDILKKC